MHMQSHDVCFTQTEIVSYFSEWCGTLATGLNNQHILFFPALCGTGHTQSKTIMEESLYSFLSLCFYADKIPSCGTEGANTSSIYDGRAFGHWVFCLVFTSNISTESGSIQGCFHTCNL